MAFRIGVQKVFASYDELKKKAIKPVCRLGGGLFY